jgi:hypothetical protein
MTGVWFARRKVQRVLGSGWGAAVNPISLLLFRVVLVSPDDRLNLSRSPCCRASRAKFVCFCALAPRGAPRLLAPDTTPQAIAF